MSISINSRSLYLESKREIASLYDEVEASSLIYWLMEDLLEITKVESALSEVVSRSNMDLQRFNEGLLELRKGRPIQHILGYGYFMGRRFRVTKETLIPRPETEELVQLILKESPGNLRVLDIGTGTGCISISLKMERPDLSVFGWDINPKALEIAELNASDLDVEVEFLPQDVFGKWPDHKYDLIVSNPPYVTSAEKSGMHRNVLNFEPSEALFVPDNDPLKYYRRILEQASTHLTTMGQVYFEINESYGKDLVDLARSLGFESVDLFQDCFGKDRMLKLSQR